MLDLKKNKKIKSKLFDQGCLLGWILFLCLAFCFGGCASSSKIRIGVSENGYDQLIGWMIRELATRQGIECQICTVSPGILNLQPALESNSLQVGIEFSQTAWKSVLHEPTAYHASDLTRLQQEYKQRNLYWYPLPMVNDHDSLAITKAVALKYDLETMGDLALVSDQLTLGAPTQYFEEEDGYPLISSLYGLNFAKTINLSDSNLVSSLLERKVDAIPSHFLDGQFQKAELILLADDLGAHEDLIAGIVITKQALMDYPILSEISQSLGRVLQSDQLIVYLKNIALGNTTPQQAALQFLKAKNLIYEKQR